VTRAKQRVVGRGSASFDELVVAAGRRTGVIWTLEGSDDLNANLVRFDAGGGVGEHVNDGVDVLFVGVAGSGSVRVDGEEHRLSAGTLVFVPKGARRSLGEGPFQERKYLRADLPRSLSRLICRPRAMQGLAPSL
jgi:quercetin dioxygenase-like cupin family protein